MPRKATIGHEELLAILLSTENVINDKGVIPGPSHDVWKDISKQINYKLKPNYTYQQVKENRHDFYSRLLQNNNITEQPMHSVEYEEEHDSISSAIESSEDEIVKPKKNVSCINSII